MAHAKLSASGAHRWLECPGSVLLEERYKNTTSTFAEEGTFAHEVAEYILKNSADNLPEYLKENEYYSTELVEYVKQHNSYVMEEFQEQYRDDKNTQMFLETKVVFDDVVPEGFGTADVIITSEKVLKIIDLKFGKGVKVSAKKNPQLRLYAYGALKKFGWLNDFEVIEMIISQPRLDHVDGDVMRVEDLVEWAEDYVRPRAQNAYNGLEEFKPGETQCKFCKARNCCKARSESMLEVVNKFNFDDPRLLSKDDVSYLLEHIPTIKTWCEDIQEYAFEALSNGETVPGYKLVEGRSTRKIKDPLRVAEILRTEGYTDDEILDVKLKGITILEKLLGKKQFSSLLADEIYKPEGKPVLATEDDKRPAIGVATVNDFKDFE